MSQANDKIYDKIKEKLEKEKWFNYYKITTSVMNGVVILEGNIKDLWQKVRAEILIKAVTGVKKVINKLNIIERKLSEEKLNYYAKAYLSKLECLFGFIGVLALFVCLIIAALLTPNYNPLFNTVSSLGRGIAKTIFSIGFVTAGSLGIPFVLYLEKTLKGVNEFIRRFASTLAVIASLCIALVGILPDPEFPDLFITFHTTVALTAFLGSVTYICLYSYLMLKSGIFKLYNVVLGFFTLLELLLLGITGFNPLIEWILTLNIISWSGITSFKLLKIKTTIDKYL